MVVLWGEVMRTLGGRTLLEEAHHWGWTYYYYWLTIANEAFMTKVDNSTDLGE